MSAEATIKQERSEKTVRVSMSQVGTEAYVTLVTSDNYVAGACVLARSLQQSGTLRGIHCLAGRGLSDASLDTLRSVFTGVTEVDAIDSGDHANLALLGRPELGPTFTKLRLWQLTQFDKVVFMDADTLVLHNIDDLFEREELSACADVGWPDCFNSGVFVARPCEDTFLRLMRMADETGSFDGGDQGLLNAFFADWSTGPASRRIPFIYNLTINASYGYAPAFARFKDSVRVVHFIGALKPWTFHRLSDGAVVPRGDASCINMDYVARWWAVYDQLTRSLQDTAALSFLPTNSLTSAGGIHATSHDIVKSYGATSEGSGASLASDSDFASYRIKWSEDVERYFQHKGQSDRPPTSSLPSFLRQQQQASRNHRHGPNVSNHRVLGAEADDDETHEDARFYADD